MMHPDPSNRLSIEDAIAAFSAVRLKGAPSIAAEPTPPFEVAAPHSINRVSSTGLFSRRRPFLPETSVDIPIDECAFSSVCVLQ